MTAPVENDLFVYLSSLSLPRAREVLGAARRAAGHPIFRRMASRDDVRVFMEHHVWAVWDFMSLLKSVQAAFAPASVPWRPPADVESARLINEIVVGEECDDGPAGRPASHFAIYLDAMEQAGADTGAIRRFLEDLDAGAPWERALASAAAPAAAKEFVEATLAVCAGPVHARVAALTVGREEVIPAMFRNILGELARAPADGGALETLRWYLDRHIDVDERRHGPMTARLFERICARDAATLDESLDVAARALAQRIALWDAVLAAIDGPAEAPRAHAPQQGRPRIAAGSPPLSPSP